MSFKMPMGKELDDLLDQLTPKDIEQIRSSFEFDVQKENLYRTIDSNNYLSYKKKRLLIERRITSSLP